MSVILFFLVVFISVLPPAYDLGEYYQPETSNIVQFLFWIQPWSVTLPPCCKHNHGQYCQMLYFHLLTLL